MRYTFNLKSPKSKKETPINFSAFFKKEGKKFVYSTDEKIKPSEWDFENRKPNKTNGRTHLAEQHRILQKRLNRFSDFFIEVIGRYKNINEDIDIETMRNEFDKHFKKVQAVSHDFFGVYDIFLESKRNNRSDIANSETTIKRYEYNKTLLKEYEEFSKTKLHFNKITEAFYNSFINFCILEKKHSANTLRRNVGLLKTFLNWAFDNGHTFKSDFKKFKTPKAQITDEVALTFDQVKEIYEFNFKRNKRLERVRDLFVLGCSTGLRISNYSKININDIENGYISVNDIKNKDKQIRIPLNDFSIEILKKYDYNLPKISTQKFNKYIKEVFKKAGYDHPIKKTTRLGSDIIEIVTPYYERISSHTARRSFITIMKNKKIPDKVIMEFTGHKSLEVFNKYYKPNDDDKKDFMTDVWKM